MRNLLKTGWRRRLWASCIAAAAALVWPGTPFAATGATGQGYGLLANANVLGIGLGVPIADTGLLTAPPNFSNSQTLLGPNISAGALLQVQAGVVNGATQSALALNTVNSTGSVTGLKLGLVNADILPLSLLSVTADAVAANAQVVCSAGAPVASGSSTVANLKVVGPLGLTIPVTVNPTGPTVVNVANVAVLTINEQIPSANGITVNALHVAINVLGLITADVVVGHAAASMTNCAAAPGSVTITAPNINAANANAVPVQGNCTAGGGPVMITSTPPLPPVSTACGAGGTYSTTINATALPDGPVTLTATQDAATASTNVTKATAAGIPTVTVAPLTPISASNQATYGPISGTCSALGQPVTVTVGTLSAPPTSCLPGGTWSIGPMNVSSLPDGPVTVTASQTNGSGTGSGSASTLKDATPPAVTIASAPPINAANAGNYTVSGTCTTTDGNVSVSFNGGAPLTTPCTSGSWTLSGTNLSALPDGTVTILATQTDAAGNSGQATRNTPKDTLPPTVTVTAPAPITAANQGSYSVSGTCSAGDGAVSVTIGTVSTVTPCTAGGTWTVTGANVANLPQGTVTITASQTDAAGNTGSGTGTATKATPGGGDTTPPVVTLVAPPINAGDQGAYSPSGTCTAGDGPVTVTIGTAPQQVTVTAPCSAGGTWTAPPSNVSALPPGPVIVVASQTDAAGNTGSAQAPTTKATPSAPVAVPVGGAWAALVLLATGALGLRRRRKSKA